MKKNSIALGTFDGIHKGHKKVLENALSNSFTPLVLTFEIPPRMNKLVSPCLLITSEEKIKRLKNIGFKPVVMDFEQVKNLSPQEFLRKIIKEFNPAMISCGFNFKFGKNAEGDTKFLEAFCKENNIKCEVAKAVNYKGVALSSTLIREKIENGEIHTANDMLGYRFGFSSKVMHGDKRGRTIGFPTINQAYPSDLVIPKFGVYSSLIEIDNKSYRAITNIGKRPTFKTDYIISESYIFDFNEDVYGKNAKVSLLKFIREEIKFNSLEELKNAIETDKNRALQTVFYFVNILNLNLIFFK